MTVEWREGRERLADFARTLATGDELVVDAALVLAYKTEADFDEEGTQYWVLAMPGAPNHATVGLLHVGIDTVRDPESDK